MRFKKADTRFIGAILALMLLIGGLPLTAGIVVLPDSGQPSLSLDLCHPLEVAAAGFSVTLARPAPMLLRPTLLPFDEASSEIPQPRVSLKITPDTPPPKSVS
ncbi:MAG TPA: hypothetical protein VMA09_09045 [Candidatus Binataceae bacterium]|nr:hypothetical protein [Candidatus Binataceae bacterium]